MAKNPQPTKKPRAAKARALPKGDKPTLADRYAYELAKRSNWRGIGDAALAGDREAIKDLAAIGTVFMHALATSGKAEANPETAEAAFWLGSILSDIHAGRSPDDAFGFTQPKHRPAEFATLRKQVMIGRHFNLLRAEKTKREVAKRIVAEHWRVSPSYAAECGDALADPKPSAKRRKK